MQFANKHWTKEQKDYVIDVWGEIPIKRIAKNIGKSFSAVTRFAERQNLGGVYQTDLYLTTTQASDIIGVNPSTVILWIKSKQLKAKTQTLKKRRIYLIDPHDFRNFLRDNQDKWNACKLQDGFFDVKVDWLIKKKDRDNNVIDLKKKTLWTIKEQNTLIQMVKQGKTNKEIAHELNRTLISVRNKRTRLKEII